MNRRQFIGSVGSLGLATTLAGCSALGSTTTLGNPSTDRSGGPGASLQFDSGGERVATLTCRPGDRRYPGSQGTQVPVDIAVSHPEGTGIQRVRLALRTPTAGATPPAAVALRAPFGAADHPFSLYEASDGTTTFEVEDLGDQGAGTVVFEFLVTGLPDEDTQLAVGSSIDLEESGPLGNRYRLDGDLRVDLPEPRVA